MKHLFLLVALLSIFSCGDGSQQTDAATQILLDSLSASNIVFDASYVTEDGLNFRLLPTFFSVTGTTLEVVTNRGCSVTYNVVDVEDQKVATREPTFWFDGPYIERIKFNVTKREGKTESITLIKGQNSYTFTNDPTATVHVELKLNTEQVTTTTYKVEKGDNATKLRNFIPADKIPKNLKAGQIITYKPITH